MLAELRESRITPPTTDLCAAHLHEIHTHTHTHTHTHNDMIHDI